MFFCVAAVMMLAVTDYAQALTIEGTEFPLYTEIDDEFATSHGVLFSSDMPFVTFGVETYGGKVKSGISGTDPSRNPEYSYAAFYAKIEITFVDPSDGVTPGVINGTVNALCGDGGGDIDYLRMRAFDASNSLMGTVLSSGTAQQNISFTGTGIHKVIFDRQPNSPTYSSSNTFLDSLSFPTPVPEPCGLVLLSLGGLVLRRKRKHPLG